MTKNELYDVVLVGKSQEFQMVFKTLDSYLIGSNYGIYGWNFDALKLYNGDYGKYYNVLYYNRNIPKRSLNVDKILHNQLKEEVKSLLTLHYDEAKEQACFIFRMCYEILKRKEML
jgi:hypothetical protein